MPKGKPYTGNRDREPGGNTMKPHSGYYTTEECAGHSPASGDTMASISPVSPGRSSSNAVKGPMKREDGDRVPYGD